MAKALIYSLSLLLMLTSYGNAQDCTYGSHLQSGQTASVNSPEYPNDSSGAHSCRWTATSDNRVKLTCGEFNLPSSDNCEESVLKVYVGRSDIPKRYCGDKTFSVESSDGEMIIEYESRNSSRPGQFLCYVQAIDETQDSDSCQCGYTNTTGNVDGNETENTKYPMMAGIISSETYKFICGATIISNKYALTVADSVIDEDFKTLSLFVGNDNTTISSKTNAANLFRIEHILIHPQYSPEYASNDIAIVTLKDTIEFTNAVSPACLPFQHRRDSFAGSLIEIISWETTRYDDETSCVLYMAIQNATTVTKCQRHYTKNPMTDSDLCTSSSEYDTWQLRSGGPALWRNPTTGKMVLAGVFNFGGMNNTDLPATSTRVGDYLDWITFNTPDAVYCMAE